MLIRVKPDKGQLAASQNLFIWEGIELLGCTHAERRGIRNNVMYKVIKIDEDVHLIRKDDESRILTLTFIQVGALLRLSYAQTYASCQGTEFEDTLRLHDTSNIHFTKRHLFVGLSRSKMKELIYII